MTATADEQAADIDADVDAVLSRVTRKRAPVLRWVVVGTALALVVGWSFVAAQSLGRDPRLVRSPLLGKPAPAIALPVLGGGRVTTADFAGEILVVNFWASWCVPCRQEAPELQSFSQRWSGRGVELLGIVYNDDEDSAAAYTEEFGLTYTQALDSDGLTALDFGVFGIPETYVIDADGIIMAKLIGALSPGTLDEVVAAVLDGETVTRQNDRYRTGPGGS